MLNKVTKVMLVDDNEIDLKINAKLINLFKLFDEIIICQSAEEALDYLNKYSSQSEKLPNLILLDIQMPDMDGFDFLEEYKNLNKALTDKCTIAMLSSTLDFGDIKRAEANPFVSTLLKKPLSIAELTALI